ncbi:MAG: hypothetical protein ABI726_01100 [bacterium]
MAATAAARRVSASSSRRASASRPALKPRPARSAPARRRSQTTPVVGLVPIAVGRTAGAVGGIADSGLVVGLARGRLWIGALAALLVGIVALNVLSLSLNASSSQVAQQADGLKRANSALQARIAGEVSNDQVLAGAAKLGLFYPATDATRYLSLKPGDAELAAQRLQAGDFAGADTPANPLVTDPVAPVPVATAPEAIAPEVVAETAAAPAPAAAVAPANVAGGVGAP